MSVEIENEYTRYVIGPNGQNLHFIEKRNDKDYCFRDPKSSFAQVKTFSKGLYTEPDAEFLLFC